MKEKIVSNEGKIFKDEKIYETEYFEVHQDWEIAIPGFYIVVPKRKLKSLLEFTDKEDIDFIRVVKKVRKAMFEVLGIKDVYYFQNEDSPYGFHLWMLPYCSWMKKVTGRGPGILVPVWKYAKNNLNTKKDIEKTKKAAQKMRDYLSKK